MFKVTLFKKPSCLLFIAVLVFVMSACSSQKNETSSPDPSTIESKTESPTASELPADGIPDGTTIPEPQTADNADSSIETFHYENQEYGIAMQFPSDWTEPQEKINENGLTVLSATEEFDNNIFILVRAIPEEALTLSEYQTVNTSQMEELYDPSMIQTNEIVTINGTDFLKVVVNDTTPDEELYQILYTSFGIDSTYEIVLTLSPDYYIEYTDLFDEIEKSILID